MFEQLHQRPAVIVQGITGTHGSFHTKAMLAAGTPIVAGVTPGKASQEVEGVPVYDTMAEAIEAHPATISVVFVPAPHAQRALQEAMDAGIKLIVCITEGIPVHDMRTILAEAKTRGVTIVGPNCPGILVPGQIKLGIIPQTTGKPGNVAIVSRSGTLTYEAAAGLTVEGIGQRYIVGIGGDTLQGTDFVACLQAFQADPEVASIVLIGEIGGQAEQTAAEYIASTVTKPVFAYVVGQSAPLQTQLGHAGAIMGGEQESAAAKTKALQAAGAIMARSLPELIAQVKERSSV